MAETLISPGVLARENDSSFVTQQPVTVGAAIIGPTVKGPFEIPTVVTTYSDYVNKFGTTFLSGGQEYSYLTSISAYNYFQNGGTSLLVARVASGSFAPASASILNTNTSASFTLKTISEGTIMNNSGSLGTNGTLTSGSADNIRWQITNRDTGSGTFSLLIRQGNDTTTENRYAIPITKIISRDTIKYINKDFSEYRASLIDYTKTYYPTTYNDFSASFT